MGGRCYKSGIIIFLLIVSLFSSVGFSDNSSFSVNLEQDISASSEMNNGEYESTTIRFYTSDPLKLSGDYIEIHAADGSGHVFWFDTSGGDAPPQSSHSMHKIAAYSLENNSEFAQALSESIDAISSFEATVFGFSVNVINSERGSVEDAHTNALGNEILVTVSKQGKNQRVDPGIDWSRSLTGSTVAINSAKSTGDNGVILIGHATGFDIDNCNDQSDSRQSTIFFFDSEGVCQWFRKIGTDGIITDLEIGNNGFFFKGRTGDGIQIAESSIPADRTFVAKLSFSGIWQWAVELPENYWEHASSGLPMSSDNHGGLIISRSYSGNNAQFGTIQTSTTTDSSGGTFVARIDSTGTYTWATTIGDQCYTPSSLEIIGDDSIFWIGTGCLNYNGNLGSHGPLEIVELSFSGEEIRGKTVQIEGIEQYWFYPHHSMVNLSDSLTITGKMTIAEPEPRRQKSIITQIDMFNLESSSTITLFEGEGEQNVIPMMFDDELCALNQKQWGGNSHTELFFADIQCFAGRFTNWSTSLPMTEYESYLADSDQEAIYTYSTVANTLTKMISPSKVDADNDGIFDIFDECLGTESGIEVDDAGCWWGQFDDDNDGIHNADDACPKWPGTECLSPVNWVLRQSLTDSTGGVREVVFSPDGSIIAAASDNTSVRIFDSFTGELIRILDQPTSWVSSVAFSNDGSLLAAGGSGYPPVVHIWDTSDWTEIQALADHTQTVRSVAFSPDDNMLASGTEDGQIVIWDVSDWSVSRKINASNFGARSVTFSPSGTLLAVGFYEGMVKIWNTSNWDQIQTIILGGGGSDASVRFSPKGEFLAAGVTGTTDSTVSLLDTSNWEVTLQYSTIDSVNSVAFSPYGNLLAIGTGNYTYNPEGPRHITTTIWNFESGQSVEFRWNQARIQSVAFSPDGSMLISASKHTDSTIHILEGDLDQDGIADTSDSCPNTPLGISINSNGCSLEQTDSDGDGVYDHQDKCNGTASGAIVDSIGCASTQIDSDGDGISDATDQCPNTPNSESVGLIGCSGSQVDTDEDGIYDSQDNCPNTPPSTIVDATGCAPNDVVDLDSDGDGVRDSVDACPNSATGIIVDSTGCETSGDVQEVEDDVSADDSSDALYGFIGLLVVIGIIAAAVAGIKSLTSSSNDSNDWDFGSYSSVSRNTNQTPQHEPNLELQNIIAELERQRIQSEREMNQLRQQQTQQSSASEIAAMQQEMRVLQQRVADSEQAKMQLQNEIELVKSQKDESINMQDSMVGGDMIASGSQKIESQTNVMGTDPEAIARIIFEAQEKERERLRKERNE